MKQLQKKHMEENVDYLKFSKTQMKVINDALELDEDTVGKFKHFRNFFVQDDFMEIFSGAKNQI